MQKRMPDSAQIESEVVALVRVLRAGESRYRANSGMNGATMDEEGALELGEAAVAALLLI